jgi:L-2-hydroxyglutarate oxidase
VATNQVELDRLRGLEEKTAANSIAFERIDRTELRRREPRIVGLGALYIPSTAIVSYAGVARAMATEFRSNGGEIRLRERVVSVEEKPDEVVVATDRGEIRARRLIACAGLFADRIANWCGVADDFKIVPFRGEYYRLGSDKYRIVNHLIYPVPDPALPFLGVHLTRMIDGSVTVGPNAVLSLKREGYGRFAFSAADSLDTLTFPGFWRVARQHLRSGSEELMNSLVKNKFPAQCKKYCPDLQASNMHDHPPGVRAQTVMRDGALGARLSHSSDHAHYPCLQCAFTSSDIGNANRPRDRAPGSSAHRIKRWLRIEAKASQTAAPPRSTRVASSPIRRP